MAKLRIGLVDIDTSHPAAWTKIIKKEFPETDVVAVLDGGTVYKTGYAEKFASENGVSKACANIEEMV